MCLETHPTAFVILRCRDPAGVSKFRSRCRALIRSTWGRVSIVLVSSNVVVKTVSFGDVLNLFVK